MTAFLGVPVALLVTVPLAWKWQLGVKRVAITVAAIGCAASLLVIWLPAPFVGTLQSVLVAAFTVLASAGLLVYRFYRDPERVAPDSPDAVVSPADGVIVYVNRFHEGVLPVSTKHGRSYSLTELTRTPLESSEAVVVGIAMSFLDVHVNRAPIDGRVTFLDHFAGSFGSLRNMDMVFENERATTVIERQGLQVAVVQIASRLVRQIAVYLRANQAVSIGQRLGVIRLGSQVDVVLPHRPDVAITVKVGERVRAGESIIAVVEPRADGTGRGGRPAAVATTAAPPGALVLGGDYRGLTIARSLGRQGVPVKVLKAKDDLLAGASRYQNQVMPWPSRPEARQVEYLLELADRQGLRGWALFPTGDEMAALLARHHAVLSEKYRVTTPPWGVVRWAYDKRLTYTLAHEAGIPIPLTFYPRSAEEAARCDLSYPVILKPAVKDRENAFTRDKAWLVEDRESLLRLYEEASRLVPADYIMVQEFIPGGGESQFSFAALCREGEVLASLTARRARQYPPLFGHSSSYVESVECREVEQAATRVLEAISYSGIVEVEFKHDRREGTYKLLDINPRVWTWHGLGARAGTDFPYLLWKSLAGEPIPRIRARVGVRWVRMSTDFPAAVRGMLRGEMSLASYARTFHRPLQFALFAADDPLPALVEFPTRLLAWAMRRRERR
jgi:D-aspartate ligase